VSGSVQIREVEDADLPFFFENQADLGASRMAAVASRERDHFDAHWAKIRADDTVIARTVLYDGEVAGHVVSFERNDLREVGYWLGRAYWGKGIATQALAAFLEEDTNRPLHALAAADNRGSVRVLEKCGFEILSSTRMHDDVRGEELDELLLRLQ
jgi:RimJ/RimL family protein N-acetyltransferase